MATEKFTNEAQSTLNGSILSTDVTLVVVAASKFPLTGQFRIRIENEIILVTEVSTNTFTVLRGQEGTVAADHIDGQPVVHIVTAGALAQLKLDILTATAPVDLTKATAAVGVATTAARSDHKHDVSTAVAGAATPGDSAAEGSATSLARSDHKHSLPAFGTASGTFTQGNDSRLSDDRTASGLRSASTTVAVSAATAPSAGQVLTATSGTAAAWQAPIEKMVDTIADLRLLTTSPSLVYVRRYAAVGSEAGGGWFELMPGSVTADNGVTWFVNASGGRYFRSAAKDATAIDVRWAGAHCDFVYSTGVGTDDTTAFLLACEIGLGITPGSLLAGGGDSFSDPTQPWINRKKLPVQITGSLRITAKVPLRYRGLRLIGGANRYEVHGGGSEIIADHTDFGIDLNTGESEVSGYYPDLEMNGVYITRSGAHIGANNNINISGVNWFNGLTILRGGSTAGKSGIGMSGYTFPYACNLRLEDAQFDNCSEFGINSLVYWDLSSIQNCTAKAEGIGGIQIAIRSGTINLLWLENEYNSNVLTGWNSTFEHFYFEHVAATTGPLLSLQGSINTKLGSFSYGGNVLAHTNAPYEIFNCIDVTVEALGAVRVCSSHNTSAKDGIWPKQDSTERMTYSTHVVERSPYLEKLDVLPSALTAVTTYSGAAGSITTQSVAGKTLPTWQIGTVGAPTMRGVMQINQPITAGHLYVLAYGLIYKGTLPLKTVNTVIVTTDSGTTIIENGTGSGLDDITLNECRQEVIAFIPTVSGPNIRLYIYPYGDQATDVGYDAYLTEVYCAEYPLGTPLPFFDVPTLLQGSDDRTASGLRTTTTVVDLSAATAPSLGQVLTATSTTAATWQSPTEKSVDTFADARALGSALDYLKVVHIAHHTTVAGGGGGDFDVYPSAGYTDDNGRVLIVGTKALVRRGGESGPINARWFGCQCDWSFTTQTGTDDTANLIRALECANELTIGSISVGVTGDVNRNISRRTRPLLVDGAIRITSPIPIRYCNIRLIGTSSGQEGSVTGMGGSLVLDHSGFGVVIDVGTDTTWVPSLSIHDLSVIRSTAHHILGESSLRLTGSNWFKGLELVNCTFSGGKSALTVDPSYILGYASGLYIENVMCVGHTTYGFDGDIFWDLSAIDHLDCKQNATGPYRLKIRSCRLGAVDIEDGGAGGVLTLWSSNVEGHYTEGTVPQTNAALTVAAINSTIGPMHNGGTGRLFNYEVVNSLYSSIRDRLPARMVTSHAIEMACDIFPPQVYTDNLCYLTHTVSRGRNLIRARQVKGAINPKVLGTASHTQKTFVDGTLLPTQLIGTVGTPVFRGGVIFVEPLTAGHIYVMAYTLTYTGTVPTESTDHLLVWDGGGTIAELTGNGLDEIELNGTRQVVFCICPQTTHPDFGLWIYPYGPNATFTGYGAQLSEVYLAELPAGIAMPSVHVPTLITGQPFYGSGTMNGTTGVAFADTGVKDTSQIELLRSTLVGTPAPHSITIVPGTGFTVYGIAADVGSAFTVVRH